MFNLSDEAWGDYPETAAPILPSRAAITAGLTAAQAAAAAHDGAILVLAGAGTGKTKTLTAGVALRIAEQGIHPSRILCVTFTNKAAAEMKGRIAAMLAGCELPGWVGTFHGLGARQLRADPEVGGLRENFDILDADDSKRLVKRIVKAMNLREGEEAGPDERDPVKMICGLIGKLKDRLVPAEQAIGYVESLIARENQRRAAVDAYGLRLAARVYLEYQRRLREANSADFGDLLLWPALTMLRDSEYRERWANRFDCVLADEYQDINHAQYVWLKAYAQAHGRLFVVGDDSQSIYSWRGSDITYIRRFTRDFPHAAQVALEDNFRSTGHILDAANAVIALDTSRLEKTLRTTKQVGDPIEVVEFRNGEEEAAGIVGEIRRRATEGLPWQDMAVLYRSNFMSRGLEEALMRAKVPYVIIGDVGFYQRAEIKDALALLRLVLNPDSQQSDEAFRRVCNTPSRGLGPKAMTALETEAEFHGTSLLRAADTATLPPKARAATLAFAEAIRAISLDVALSVADTLALLLDRTGYRAMLRESRAETDEGRLDNLQELLQLAGSFQSISELLDHAALASAAPGEEVGGRVQLMTLHKGKGLEFRQVFLPGWDQGCFPSAFGDADEERRLAYVALTRGMERVSISHVEYRRGYTRPSPFLADIPAINHVTGWLRSQRADGSGPRRIGRHYVEDVGVWDRA